MVCKWDRLCDIRKFPPNGCDPQGETLPDPTLSRGSGGLCSFSAVQEAHGARLKEELMGYQACNALSTWPDTQRGRELQSTEATETSGMRI